MVPRILQLKSYHDESVPEYYWLQCRPLVIRFQWWEFQLDQSRPKSTQWMRGKVANLESMVSVHSTILSWAYYHNEESCFDTDFPSQMKFTELPLIHCFIQTFFKAQLFFYSFCQQWSQIKQVRSNSAILKAKGWSAAGRNGDRSPIH